MTELDIESMAQAKFEGLDKKTLLAVAKVLNMTFAPATSEKTIRQRLCGAMGQAVGDENPTPARTVRRKPNGIFDPKPQLKDIHDWGGKRRNVIVHKPGADDQAPINYLQLGWEGQKRYYAYGAKLSLPWPLYQALINTERRTITQEEVLDKNHRLIGIKNVENSSPFYNFRDIGDEPGTEHLPESTVQYWQWQARKHNNFRDENDKPYGRRILTMIRSDLYGPVGPDFYKDMTDEDILSSVLEFLWGDYSEHDVSELSDIAA